MGILASSVSSSQQDLVTDWILRKRERQYFRIIPKFLVWMTGKLEKVTFFEGGADLAGKRMIYVTYTILFLHPGKNF